MFIRMKQSPKVIHSFSAEALTPPPFELLFRENGYRTHATEIREQLQRLGRQCVHQCIQSGQIKRKKINDSIVVENYIDEMAVIIPAPIQFHSNYDEQAFALLTQKASVNPSLAYPRKLITPNAIDGKALSLTAKKILYIVARNTNLISGECCITCTNLYRLAGIPRSTIDKVMSSPVMQDVLVKYKFSGCRAMGFYWTDKGKEIMLAKPLGAYAKKLSEGVKTDWPNYSFQTHTALIKWLRDEYKKQLRNSQIPIVQKEAAISLALLDSY